MFLFQAHNKHISHAFKASDLKYWVQDSKPLFEIYFHLNVIYSLFPLCLLQTLFNSGSYSSEWRNAHLSYSYCNNYFFSQFPGGECPFTPPPLPRWWCPWHHNWTLFCGKSYSLSLIKSSDDVINFFQVEFFAYPLKYIFDNVW